MATKPANKIWGINTIGTTVITFSVLLINAESTKPRSVAEIERKNIQTKATMGSLNEASPLEYLKDIMATNKADWTTDKIENTVILDKI